MIFLWGATKGCTLHKGGHTLKSLRTTALEDQMLHNAALKFGTTCKAQINTHNVFK